MTDRRYVDLMKMTPKIPKVKDIKTLQSDTTGKFFPQPFGQNTDLLLNPPRIQLKHDIKVRKVTSDEVCAILVGFMRSEAKTTIPKHDNCSSEVFLVLIGPIFMTKPSREVSFLTFMGCLGLVSIYIKICFGSLK